jgi:beta-lactamase regulating signal transducer with metallopeptidase domain
MNALIAIALKSLLVAGITLLVLRLVRDRSAAERSWVAHVGLLALVVLPFAPLAIPVLPIETAAVGQAAPEAAPATATAPTVASPMQDASAAGTSAERAAASALVSDGWTTLDIASFLYWIPAGLLLALTLIALARLVALRARAEVLVDSHWLSALARAQKRMGFKHGTALLTSNDLPSPISWGLMRPVILLNDKAVEAADEAEAIIAHELAHVARLDWIKLLLARVATALFWFNPFVWLLAREAHQLREEAADDTVLAADIADTEYAQLLVGIARHECKGLLIGAHGVAPSKGSLARRVARVLNSASPRGPAARSFAAGVFVGALAMATPLAAVTLVPAGTKGEAASGRIAAANDTKGYYPAGPVPLPQVVSNSVDQAVTSAVQAVTSRDPNWIDVSRDIEKEVAKSREKRIADAGKAGEWRGIGPKPGSVGPKGPIGPRALRDDNAIDEVIDEVIALKAVGATPEYARQIRAAAPNLGPISTGDLTSLKAVGVTPAYIAELSRAGYRNLDAESLIELRALNVRGEYIKGMADAGYPNLPSDRLVEMKAVGVTPAKVRKLRRQGYPRLAPEQLVGLVAVEGSSHHHGDDDDDDDGDDGG